MSEKVKQSFEGLGKALTLAAHFFLIVTAYYQVKPASRTLFITYIGSDFLPYVWIASACVLVGLLPYYNLLVERHSRSRIIFASCIAFAITLSAFRLLLDTESQTAVVAFYILVDVYGVVLIEQFWGLTASSYRTSEGKTWYGMIGSGALIGGIVGSLLATFLLKHTGLKTIDLPLIAAMLLLLLLVLSYYSFRKGLVQELSHPKLSPQIFKEDNLLILFRNPYVLLIAALLLCSQLVEPIVEYQFLGNLEESIQNLRERTAYLSSFFVVLGLVALAINLFVTPLVHRFLGTIAGLAVQPILLIAASLVFISSPSLFLASALKIVDRGLSYSISRASKELLYIPLAAETIYRLKAIVDMVGFRVFKILASSLILILSSFFGDEGLFYSLIVALLALAGMWLFVISKIRPLYADLQGAEEVGSEAVLKVKNQRRCELPN